MNDTTAKGNRIFSSISNKLDTINPIFLSLIITIISFIYSGYSFSLKDHALQIPLAKSYVDSEIYHQDIVISQTGYVTLLWNIIAILSQFVPLWAIVLLLYFMCLWGYFYYIYQIGAYITKSGFGGSLAVLLLLTPKPGIAYSIMTHDTWFSLRLAALPLVMAALYYAISQRYILCYFFLGLAFNIHLISATHVLFLILSYQLYQYIYSKTNSNITTISDLVKPIVVFLVTSIPALYLIFKVRFLENDTNSSSFIASSQWLEIMRMRNVHVVFPLYFDYYALLNVPVYLLLIYFTQDKMETEIRKLLQFWVYTIMFLFVLSIAFSHLLPVVILIQLQFVRALRYLPIIATMFIVNYIDKFRSNQNISFNELIILIITILFIFTGFFILTITILALGVLTIHLQKSEIRTQRFNLYNFKLQGYRRRFMFGLIISILLLHQISGIYIQDGRIIGNIHPVSSMDNDWRDVQLWVKENTAKHSLFITPPHLFGFRVFSERSIVGEWKDGTLAFFNQTFGYEWWYRMQDLGYTKHNYKKYDNEIYRNLNFTALSAKYKAQYAIITAAVSPQKLHGSVLYNNDVFSVFQLVY